MSYTSTTNNNEIIHLNHPEKKCFFFRGFQHAVKTMKKYRVYVYNNEEKFHDCYEVNAKDPVDARNAAVQRLVEETGDGLNIYEITEVQKVD